jgi:hypothetical protein
MGAGSEAHTHPNWKVAWCAITSPSIKNPPLQVGYKLCDGVGNYAADVACLFTLYRLSPFAMRSCCFRSHSLCQI